MNTVFLSLNVAIYADSEKNIIEIKWNGKVPLEDCLATLQIVKDNLEEHCLIIINRSSLDEFTIEAKKWLKTTFMTKEVIEIVPFLSKLAIIEAGEKINIFSLAINRLASLMFPGLSMRSFSSYEEAAFWLSKKAAKRSKRMDKKIFLSYMEHLKKSTMSLFNIVAV